MLPFLARTAWQSYMDNPLRFVPRLNDSTYPWVTYYPGRARYSGHKRLAIPRPDKHLG